MAAGIISNARVRYANTWLSASRREVSIYERNNIDSPVCKGKEKVFEKIKKRAHERLSRCI
jgi:hypothetical protein